MQYISTEIYLKIFSGQNEQGLQDNYNENLQKLQLMNDEDLSQVFGSGFPFSKLNLIESYMPFEKKEVLIFHQWIAQSTAVKSFLSGGEIQANDLNKTLNPEHFLYASFSNFVSPMLVKRILPVLEKNKPDLNNLVSTYLCILNKDANMLVQQRLTKISDQEWMRIEDQLPAVKNENQLVKLISPYFSDHHIDILNRFDKSHYSAKIAVIDRAMSIFSHAQASHRMAYWIINQLNKLNLNSEHKEMIKEVQLSIKRGDSTYFKRKSSIKGGFSKRSGLVLTMGMLLIGAVFFIAYKFPNLFDDSPEVDEQQSSFQQFTKQERMQLDSLIKTMEKKPETEEPVMDQGTAYLHLTPVSITLVDRDPLENKKVEQFIQDNRIANQLAVEGHMDSCSTYSSNKVKYLSYPDFQKLSQSTGSKTLFFKNESAYQVLIVLFDERSGGAVYASVLLPDQEIKFQSDPGKQLILLPGSDLGAFYCSQNVPEQPSKAYKHHFCYTDQNFEAQLYKTYEIDHTNEKTIKILFNQTDEDQFYIVDIYKALLE